MKHIRKRISRIIDELVTYFFTMGATDINVRVKEEEDRFVIFLKTNYTDKNKDKLDKLVRYLECDKQEEMEEYYWELAGDSDVDTELTLVGMMTDEVEIDIGEDEINIVLYRDK